MKLIVITLPQFFEGEAECITALFQQGLEILHLRKPEASEAEMAALIERIPATFHSRLVLHDHHQLAMTYGLRGIHLNGRHPQPPVGYTGCISRSCHSLAEVERYKAACDYVFLSPIFNSISKQGYQAAFSALELQDAHFRGLIDEKVMALGGISADHLCEVQQWGFGGVVLLGNIWMNEQPVKQFLKMKETLDKTTFSPAVILTIAGSDCSGGAGVQADIKTISSLGGYAASVITAITAQNTMGVTAIQAVTPEVVSAQIAALFDDLHPAAVKTGMVYSPEIVQAIADGLKRYQPPFVVCDPVMISTSGHRLITEETVASIQNVLFPCCSLITPNLHEASLLAGRTLSTIEEMEIAAKELSDKHHLAVLIKGGHLNDDNLCDVLYADGQITRYPGHKIDTKNLHGTGCTLSSAIATFIGKGLPLAEAVGEAKAYVTRSIERGKDMHIGHGNGPLWHF